MSMKGVQSQRQLVKQTVMILNRRMNNNVFEQCWQPAGGSQTCSNVFLFFFGLYLTSMALFKGRRTLVFFKLPEQTGFSAHILRIYY